ncbi:MAG: SusC/RagA family TonB-linked outer membrane protein [Muribaculaceae bacterium]|nr:SusC/RagA family TonB-linked outer membrane protein [Muribaculaceae bacterium]
MKKTYIILLTAAISLSGTIPGVKAQENDMSAVDTIPVAFRSVSETEVMGGISTVNVAELQRKSYSDYSLSDMQALVTGYDGQLWGMGDVLVLVDGVPRDANNIIPTEIESISFLKGAQAVILYGSTAAKGAILITTKRGNSTGLEVTVKGNASIYVPKRYPKYLGAAEYMTLYNEARANDGLDAAFSDEDIYHYASGTNPYRYPDINFFSDDYLRKNTFRYEGQAEFKGGGSFATFYALVGIYHSNSLIKFGEGKNNGTTRLNMRGNIDLKLNQYVSGWVNTSATFYDNRYDRSNYWAESATMRPTVPGSSPLVPLIPIDAIEQDDENSWIFVNNSRFLVDGKYLLGGTQQYQTNPFAAMYAAGYTKATTRQLQFDAGLKIDLKGITPGLSFKARGAVDYYTYYNTSIQNSYATYQATWTNYNGKDVIRDITKFGDDLSTGTQNISFSSERQTLLFSGQFDYTRSFNGVNNVEANLIAYGYKRTYTGQYHRTTNANLALRAAYNYDQRYYAEFNGAVNHSAKFAPGHRNGISAVGTLGWRIDQEAFLKDNPNVDALRLNVTYGRLLQDIDIDGYYLYDSKYTADGDWWGWNDGNNAKQTFVSRQGENPDLTFVKRIEFNAGFDAAFWNRQLKFQANYFTANIDGLPIQATNLYPSYMGTYYPNSSFIPWINYNKQRRYGFDLGLSGNHQFGPVYLELGLTMMYTKSKNIRVSENVEYDWLRTEGKSVDALWGYECLGFFQNEEEIASSAVINNNTKPGDLKYRDLNNDGIIDNRDRTVIGNWSAPWHYGLNFTAKYKGFTLFVTATANTGGTGLMSNTYAWVYGDRKYSTMVRGRWTPETAATATYPRLTTQGGELNFVSSDFWTFSTDTFSLDQIQLTYDFPAKWFENKFVKGLSLYVNANSLVMACKNKEYRELNIGYEPYLRTYNFGVNINF